MPALAGARDCADGERVQDGFEVRVLASERGATVADVARRYLRSHVAAMRLLILTGCSSGTKTSARA